MIEEQTLKVICCDKCKRKIAEVKEVFFDNFVIYCKGCESNNGGGTIYVTPPSPYTITYPPTYYSYGPTSSTTTIF